MNNNLHLPSFQLFLNDIINIVDTNKVYAYTEYPVYVNLDLSLEYRPKSKLIVRLKNNSLANLSIIESCANRYGLVTKLRPQLYQHKITSQEYVSLEIEVTKGSL